MAHPLFQPFTLKKLRLKNRLIMAPMTRCRAGDGDVPTSLMAEYYAQRATAGLIVTEGTPVSPQGRGYLWTPGIYTPDQIEGWRGVTDAVHTAAGLIFAQIWHVGRVSHVSLQPDGASPLGPTDQLPKETQTFAYDDQGHPGYVPASQPHALSGDEIHTIVAQFAQAAENAATAGFDGVEVHGANGYLFDQFLNAGINNRQDDYGGTPENRCRLLLEAVDAAADSIGADRVGVRISPNGRFNGMPEDPEMTATLLHLAQELDRRAIAYLHLNDQRTFGEAMIPDQFLAKLRHTFSGAIIICGGYDVDRAQQVIDSGLVDLVAFGTLYIANPDLPARMAQGWPLNDADQNTFYGGGAEGYTDYPLYTESD